MRKYQEEVLEKICDSIEGGRKKVRVAMATGTGRSFVMAALAVKQAGNGGTVLILSPKSAMCDQLKELIQKNADKINISICSRCSQYDNENILITTYLDVKENITEFVSGKIDVVICDGIKFGRRVLEEIYLTKEVKAYIGFTSSMDKAVDGWFSDSVLVYKYSYADAIKDGYSFQYEEYGQIESFCIQLLEESGFDFKDKPLHGWGDLKAVKSGTECFFEIKTYKSPWISSATLNRALEQAAEFKQKIPGENKLLYLFMFCVVNQNEKEKIYDDKQIFVIDIANFLYLCRKNEKLYKKLTKGLPFSVDSIKQCDVISNENLLKNSVPDDTEDNEEKSCEIYIEELLACPTGKERGADQKYERICSEIISLLFESCFSARRRQLWTNEGLFAMDMVCTVAINNKNAFWEFLRQFYQTRYIVFEFKNYRDEIKQNLICTTEKYLSQTALRKVAFIISRKGFDPNAQKIALRSLKEHGNLIVSLDDEDLINMLTIKMNGREATDYLVDKIDQILMYID